MRRTHRRVRPSANDASDGTTRRVATRAAPARRSAPGLALLGSFQHLAGEIFRMNGRLLDVADSLVQDLQVTPTHWQIIAIIRNEPLAMAAIGRCVGLRRQSVLHNVRKLEGLGIVELANNPDHRRASLIRLTPAGHKLMEKLMIRQVELTTRFTAGLGLSATDMDNLASTLQMMRERSERRPHRHASLGDARADR